MDSRQKEERREGVRRTGDPWIRKQILKTLVDILGCTKRNICLCGNISTLNIVRLLVGKKK